ncbi:MAG: beta strand repeat-containing protein, partial [Paludibacter sp.]
LSRGVASNGINLAANTSSWDITNSSFYETASFVPTASVAYNILQINNTSGINFNVSGNYIGGKAAQCSTGAWTKTNAQNNAFTAINFSVGTDSVSNIQNNTIQNISWSNSGAATWSGINIADGKVNIGTTTGNTIGASTGTTSITVTGGATATNVYGINIASVDTINCQNNLIGSVIATNSSTNATNFYGINKTATSGVTTINENIIGSTITANSINASSGSTSNAQSVYGIYNAGTGTVLINNNTIANVSNGTTNSTAATAGVINGITSTNGTTTISNNTIRNLTIANRNTATNNTAAIIGIVSTGTSNEKKIESNLIYSLSNTYATYAGRVVGIYYEGATSGTNEVSKNFIHSLSTTGTSGASLLGIQIVSGVTTYSNNIINLGSSNQNSIYGIYDTGATSQTCNLYFNTVYIGGVVSAGAYNSFAFYNAAASNTRNYKDNIFYNARYRSGGTSSHFSIYYNVTGVSNLTADYNDYYVSAGTGAVLAYYGSNRTTLALLKTAITPQDPNSLNTNPTFTLAGSTVATDYQLGVSVNGVTGTGIAVDYGLNSRGGTPTVGAWERNLNKWKGTTSNDWNTATNWTGNSVPAADASITFDDVPLQHCVMDQNRSVTNIINAQSTYRVVTNGYKLTIKGNLNFTNGAQVDASSTNSTIEFAGTSQTIPNGSFYNDEIYNLTINNPNNVLLNDTLRLLNSINATSGRLDAITSSPIVIYAGSSPQVIEGNRYLNDEVYKLTIDNASGVTLDTDFTVDSLLTINSGKSLTIPPVTQMNVIGTITNSAGNSGIVIKSDSLSANGTLIFHNLSSSPVAATVEMYTKGAALTYNPSTNRYSNYKWQFFGIPLDSVVLDPTFYGSFVRKWVESGTTIANHWISFTHKAFAFKGYEITQVSPKIVYFEGNLVNSDYSSGQLPYTSSALYPGQNILANPYTAAIDIRQLSFGAQTEWTVYLYNTGSYSEWLSSGGESTPGTSPGQYTAIPKNTAG